MSRLHIMIVEDEAIIALGLELAVLDIGAIVAGPVGSAHAAHRLLDCQRIDAAILDGNLEDGDAAAIAERLIAQRTPFVFHSATGLPFSLIADHVDLPMVGKPARPESVVSRLLEEVRNPH